MDQQTGLVSDCVAGLSALMERVKALRLAYVKNAKALAQLRKWKAQDEE